MYHGPCVLRSLLLCIAQQLRFVWVRVMLEKIRMYLQGVDDGLLTESEAEHRMLHDLLRPYVERAALGQETGIASSWCGAAQPLFTRVNVTIELDTSRIWFKPIT